MKMLYFQPDDHKKLENEYLMEVDSEISSPIRSDSGPPAIFPFQPNFSNHTQLKDVILMDTDSTSVPSVPENSNYEALTAQNVVQGFSMNNVSNVT